MGRDQFDFGGETFMLTWGDGVGKVDLNALLDFHRSHGKLATLTAVRPPARYGHPAGLSVIAIAGPNPRSTLVNTHSADRENNMWAFTEAALALLLSAITKSDAIG